MSAKYTGQAERGARHGWIHALAKGGARVLRGISVLLILGLLLGASGLLGEWVARAAPPDLTVTPAINSLSATVGTPFNAVFSASGGTAPYSYSMTGAVPGLSFTAASATLTGNPTDVGSFNISINAQDSASPKATGASAGALLVRANASTSITSLTSVHPGGASNYMVGFAVQVAVQVSESAGGAHSPTGTVTVSAGGNPTCTATIDAGGAGSCALFFTTSGSKTILASYNGDTYFIGSTSNGSNITVAALSLSRSLSAGRGHTCLLETNGALECWGNPDATPTDDITQLPVIEPNVTSASAGGYHTCAIKTDGTLECWSDNALVRSIPPGLRWLSVSAGNDHVCAIDSNYNLQCWGSASELLAPPPAGQFKTVSAGNGHDCAIKKSDSSLACWGNNANNRLNAPGGAFKAVAAGESHTCAIANAGSVNCWGLNAPTPPVGSNYIQIDSGSGFSCVRNSGGVQDCFGGSAPVVDESSVFADMRTGFGHVCALKDNGGGSHYLACWGDNQRGQAPRLSLAPPSFLPYLARNHAFTQVFTPTGGAAVYTLANPGGGLPTGMNISGLSVTGTPSAVGSFNFNLRASEQFANSSLPLELIPVTRAYSTQVQDPATTASLDCCGSSVPAGSPVPVTVTVSKSGTPALTGTVTVTSDEPTASCTVAVTGGTAACSLFFSTPGVKTIQAKYDGDSFYDASATVNKNITITAITIEPALSAGNGYTCAYNSNGTLDCWGYNDAGQASPPPGAFNQLSAGDAFVCARSLNGVINCWGWNGFGVISLRPTAAGYVEVGAGVNHACARLWDGSLTCWGSSANGRTTPPVGTFSKLSVGDSHACALDGAGTATCWGNNANGQTSAPGGSFIDLSAGGSFTCGLRSDNSLECWGGSGTIAAILTEPPGSFKRLEAGFNHACAIKSDDSLACWGDNSAGKATPPAGSFKAVSAGRDHTCALRSDGYLQCWGANANGQAPVLDISPDSLATIDVDLPWSFDLEAAGGRSSNLSFSIAGGALPDDVTIDSSSGLLAGTPSAAGVFSYTVRVVENDRTPGLISEQSYQQTVRADVDVEITSLTPAQRMVGRPVLATVSISEGGAGGAFVIQPSGSFTVTADDGTLCSASLSGGSGSCYLFFTSAGEKNLSASYPGDANFKPGGTAAPSSLTVLAFSQSPQVFSGQERTYIHLSNGYLACLGSGCSAFDTATVFSAVDVGDELECVLQTDGKAHCLLNGLPADPPEAENYAFTTLSVGHDHACAVRAGGSLACWGSNSGGKATPLAGSYTAVSAGGEHTCALTAAGSLACWGSSAGSPPPGVFTALSAGDAHTCALDAAGSLSCWGDDSFDQASPPTGTFTTVSAGARHTCALRSDGQVRCWGDDSVGQADAPYRPLPKPSANGRVLAPYGSYTALAAFDDHNCALRPGPMITCWGQNDAGEAPRIQLTPLTDNEIVVNQYWEHAFNPDLGVKPYTGAVAEGSLPPGVQIGLSLSPAGVILYGVPEEPGIYPFTLTWQDASPIPLYHQQPYTLIVTGADLGVQIIASHTSTALMGEDFSLQYVISNTSNITVPQALFTTPLVNGLKDMLLPGAPGCVFDAGLMTCQLINLPPNSTWTLDLSGEVIGPPGMVISTTAQVTSTLVNWPEIAPQDNLAVFEVQAGLSAVWLDEDFGSIPLDPAWSDGDIITTTTGVSYLGDFAASDALRLTYTDLPAHSRVIVTFDVYVIGDWQGNASVPPGGVGQWNFGPFGGPALLTTTFCADAGACMQAFPGVYPGDSYTARSGAVGEDELGLPGVPDTRYSLRFDLAHSAAVLDLLFSSLNLPPGARWGLDNVLITLEAGAPRLYLPLLHK